MKRTIGRRDDYLAAKRAAWDAAAPHRQAREQYARLVRGFAKPGFIHLDPTATRVPRRQ